MKRILAILCVIACLCGLCVPAMAAGTITVSVKAPDDWAQVCLYVWENDQPMEGWPGTAMTKGANGLWTLQIPAGSYTNVIANNGSDAGKTADLKMDGSADCWIDAGAGVVYTDAAMSKPFGGNAGGNNGGGNAGGPVDLSGLNSLALVGGGIPGLPEWNPGDAAGNMTKVSNGVYTKVIAVTAGASMEIKAAGNGAWNDAYNFGPAENGTAIVLGTKMEMVNGGGAQNFALTATKDCNLKFTVDLTGDVPTLLVEETDEEPSVTPVTPPATSGETITVYAKVPDAWSDVRVWAWDDTIGDADPSGWPGTLTMTKGDDGWYSVQVPNWVTGLLIHANGASVQTPDIEPIEAGKDIWINAYTDVINPTFAYEEITDIAGPAETEPPTGPSKPAAVHPTEPAGQGEAGTDNTVLFSIIGSVVVIAIAAVVFFILKGKKKAA